MSVPLDPVYEGSGDKIDKNCVGVNRRVVSGLRDDLAKKWQSKETLTIIIIIIIISLFT